MRPVQLSFATPRFAIAVGMRIDRRGFMRVLAWVDDTATCLGDPDVCAKGATQTGATVCGLADEGFLNQRCILGNWVDGEECSTPVPEPTTALLQVAALLTLLGLRRRCIRIS